MSTEAPEVAGELHPGPGPRLLSRRTLLARSACGFGQVALAGVLADEALRAAATGSGTNPLAPRPSHFPARASRVIFLFMHGGVSHVDTFDPNPKLAELDGQPPPIKKPEFEFSGNTNNLLKSPWRFTRWGESGIEVSELFPHIAGRIDDICVIRSMNGGNQVAHGGAALNLHTGDAVFIRPSMGAWTLYGLGTENREMPGFISLAPSNYHGGSQNYGSAFLPASYQATRIGDGSTPFAQAKLPDLVPSEPDRSLQRLQLDLLGRHNRRHLERTGSDPRLEARIRSFELAFRMQVQAPKVFDIAAESKTTQQAYGIGRKPTDEFGRMCLLGRRLSESGVRFVQLNYSYPRSYWDAHGGLRNNHTSNAARTDKPIAGLIADLAGRGLLDETLVVWGTEFGRTPAAQGKDGRDHHPHAFTMWMAGGGVRAGTVYGKTDEFGYYVLEDMVAMHDFHATVLHLLGLDHTRLTYRYSGRDFRLTDVDGEVVEGIVG